jgi:hypothetical protein
MKEAVAHAVIIGWRITQSEYLRRGSFKKTSAKAFNSG